MRSSRELRPPERALQKRDAFHCLADAGIPNPALTSDSRAGHRPARNRLAARFMGKARDENVRRLDRLLERGRLCNDVPRCLHRANSIWPAFSTGLRTSSATAFVSAVPMSTST